MTDRLYAKYMWLISTIYDAGKISFEDIARKWDNAYINDLHQPFAYVGRNSVSSIGQNQSLTSLLN